jgi:ferredoxin
MIAGARETEPRAPGREAALPAPAIPPPPPPAARGERFLARVDQALAVGDGWIARWLPLELNPLAQSGRAANFALVVAVVTGVVLLCWYSPSVQFAHSSLAALGAGSLGGWVRALHRYSSDLVMLLLVVHAGRMLVARKFTGARWLPWVSGLGLTGLIWFIGWTGYWLVWDQPAQQVAVMSLRLLDTVPIFGEPLGRLLVVDRLVPSLLFFVVFFLHMLLPLAIGVGLAVHLLRLSRVRLLPDWRLGLALTLGLLVASAVVPAPLDEPAAMAVKATHFTVDTWYLWPLALAGRLQHAGLWVALGGTLGVVVALPWLLGRRRRPETFQAVVDVSRCHACTQCMQDCPFDAITMVPRTDGKAFPSQSYVDPARCVGCGVCAGSCDSEGISLPWFATAREEARMEREVAQAIVAGAPPWVALVAGDADSGFALFALTRWRERLPGYQVHVVPTASWVRPVLVERWLRSGVKGVLLVRDARAEAPARDGNRWVAARLAGERDPVFRPQRAGTGGSALVLDYDPSRPDELRRAAERFRNGEPTLSKLSRTLHRAQALVVVTVLALLMAGAVIAPSHLRVSNPQPADPEFVFSFKAFGAVAEAAVLDLVADAAKPIHMRGRVTEKPQRSPVVVRLTVDGETEERSYRGKGLTRDGPAIDEWRKPLPPGPHRVKVEVLTGADQPPLEWEHYFEAQDRRVHVLTLDPADGFRWE